MEDSAMKTAQVVALAIVSITNLPLMARPFPKGGTQDASGSPSLGGSAGAQSPQANPAGPGSATSQQNANAAAAHAYSLVVSEMRPVSGELEGKLNSQSAKPGDRVIVKTTQRMMTADGTEVPKGSLLLGHITAAQAYTKGASYAQMKIAFDGAELHGGGSIAIHSMIQTVAPSRRESSDIGYGGAGAGTGSEAGMGGGPAMGGEAGGMGGPDDMGGQRGMGGPAGGVRGAGGPAVGQVDTNVDTTVGRSGDAIDPMAASIPASMPGPMYGVVQLSDSLAPRYTGFPGVMLQADASGAASGTLFAANQNILLDAGTRVVLGIVATGK
jgi:hypothetical protein